MPECSKERGIFGAELIFYVRLSSSHLLPDLLSSTLGDRTSSGDGLGILLIATSGFDLCSGCDFCEFCCFRLENYFGA